MRTTRIFIDLPLAPGATADLPATACDHLLRVLRMGEGAHVTMFNGDGNDYAAELVGVGKRGASARVVGVRTNPTESLLRIVLAQAIARGEKMDWVVQKATELGVSAIQPVVTERTEVRLDAERADRRLHHWQGVASAACEQCGRARVPDIAEPRALGAWLGSVEDGAIRLALDPEGGTLKEHADAMAGTCPGTPIVVVVGPEGGFSDRDQAQLRAAGFHGLRLGPRILRTETAGVAAVAALQALLGDLAA